MVSQMQIIWCIALAVFMVAVLFSKNAWDCAVGIIGTVATILLNPWSWP